MGRDGLESGARQGASGNNFKLSTRRNPTGNVLVADAGAAMAAPAAPATVRLTSDLWARARRLLAVVAAGASALIVPFALHTAAVNAPSLHAALATMMTLFALAAAWLLRAQFASSRRGRDLLLLAVDARAGAADVRSGGGSRGRGSARRHLLRQRRAVGSVGRRRDVRRCGVRAVGLADRAAASSDRDHARSERRRPGHRRTRGAADPDARVGGDARRHASDSRWCSSSWSGPPGCSPTRR